MLTEYHCRKYKSLMYALRAVYNNYPKLPQTIVLLNLNLVDIRHFSNFQKICILTQQFFHHTNAHRVPLMEIWVINACLGDIYLHNPKLPADNCVIKPQTCEYSSYYQISRYTYIDTTILSSHKCLQSTTVGNISH